MATTKPTRTQIAKLKAEYDQLRPGKESLLVLIEETEIPESVYNSNAIENSTLTLDETEKILLEMEVSRRMNVREVFEAKNLARVTEYIRNHAHKKELNLDMILTLHSLLLGNINDKIAGRLRIKGEYVRVGKHIAAPPEHLPALINELLTEENSDYETYFLDKIARFHLKFETIHPFNDGNGRIGRILVNYQLLHLGFPGIIIRNKEKKEYMKGFAEYQKNKNTKITEKIFSKALTESLHKRLAYLKGQNIITLSEYAKNKKLRLNTLLNAAKRQNIKAFREKGAWKIAD
ncbi:Fic family protein [bacterium]|nr:Fic family protein [bacterium]